MSELSSPCQESKSNGAAGKHGGGREDLTTFLRNRSMGVGSSSSSMFPEPMPPFIPKMSDSTLEFDNFVRRLRENQSFRDISGDNTTSRTTVRGVEYDFRLLRFSAYLDREPRAVFWPPGGRLGFTPQSSPYNLDDLANIPIIIKPQEINVILFDRVSGLPQSSDEGATIIIAGRIVQPKENGDVVTDIAVNFRQTYSHMGDDKIPSEFDRVFTRIPFALEETDRDDKLMMMYGSYAVVVYDTTDPVDEDKYRYVLDNIKRIYDLYLNGMYGDWSYLNLYEQWWAVRKYSKQGRGVNSDQMDKAREELATGEKEILSRLPPYAGDKNPSK